MTDLSAAFAACAALSWLGGLACVRIGARHERAGDLPTSSDWYRLSATLAAIAIPLGLLAGFLSH